MACVECVHSARLARASNLIPSRRLSQIPRKSKQFLTHALIETIHGMLWRAYDEPQLISSFSMLARMAFGITSPRLTYQKLSTSHSLFGCMDDVDFGSLVKAFDKECAAAGYIKVQGPVGRFGGLKRPHSQTSSTRGGKSSTNSRGGSSSKRGRRS
jgi:hypothetical protein